MRSRMDRYDDFSTNNIPSRREKNQKLYQDLGKNTKYTNFTDVSRTNAIEINNNRNYNTREGYHQMKEYNGYIKTPKVKKELDDFNYLYQDHENRVYDINSVLQNARDNRGDLDELEKKRKLKNTNYNILASLNPEKLEKYRKEKQEKKNIPNEDELRDLIDTITSKTLRGEIDQATSVNLLSDLMATSANDKIDVDEQLDLSKKILDKDIIDKMNNIKDNNNKDDLLKDMDKSFYTKSMDLSDKDFNLDEEEEGPKKHIVLKILLTLLLLGVVAVIIIFLIKSF